ncbi:MAG TPA: hypothetical protein VJQ79_03085 [Acidimicrobiia bacterium]|nr:hypothetical protein [Acidimicrobiia bacterium]
MTAQFLDSQVDSLTRFRELQSTLAEQWQYLTPRSVGDRERTLLVVNSVNVRVPAHMAPVLPAYEERFLFLMLTAVRNPRTRVIYVTSQPVLPRLIEYYMSLMPGSRPPGLAERLLLVSVGDGSARPLVEKVLARPHLIERLRSLIGDRGHRLMLPFSTTIHEAELGSRLGIPVYGPDPSLSFLGTKSGSRQTFAEAGVAHPDGREGIRTIGDAVDALVEMKSKNSDLRAAVVKLDDSVGGMGNAIVELEGADTRLALRRRVEALRPDDHTITPEEFVAELGARGGIIEERIEGEAFHSPSVQLRASPLREVEVLSTHDQILGGATGQEFLGCRFPADREYGWMIAGLGERIGSRLAQQGVIGRFGIDFVVVRRNGEWLPYAIEVNLRNGGTTHPMLTLGALTDGEFDPRSCRFRVEGGDRYYVATDHLERPGYASLTPDDVLDRVSDPRLAWNEDDMVGVALHLVSAVAVAGRLGLTAIGTDRADAERRFEDARAVIDELAGPPEPTERPLGAHP